MFISLTSQLVTLAASYNFFFFNDTATTEIYTLSLHDALPISYSCDRNPSVTQRQRAARHFELAGQQARNEDRNSTRLNSSHANISYPVFCLKKKNSASCCPHREAASAADRVLCLCHVARTAFG